MILPLIAMTALAMGVFSDEVRTGAKTVYLVRGRVAFYKRLIGELSEGQLRYLMAKIQQTILESPNLDQLKSNLEEAQAAVDATLLLSGKTKGWRLSELIQGQWGTGLPDDPKAPVFSTKRLEEALIRVKIKAQPVVYYLFSFDDDRLLYQMVDILEETFVLLDRETARKRFL